MSKISHLPKTLPGKELPFNFKGTGDTTGHKYEGSFVVKVPSVRDISKIGIELAKINDGVPVELLDNMTAALNRAIAFLSVCIVEGPAWFTNNPEDGQEEGMAYGMETLDLNVPIEIYKEADKLVAGWHDKLKQRPKTSKKSAESAE